MMLTARRTPKPASLRLSLTPSIKTFYSSKSSSRALGRANQRRRVHEDDDANIQLTEEERKLMEMDYVEDEDQTIEIDEASVFIDDDGEKVVIIGAEGIDQEYDLRKLFMDEEDLTKNREFGKAMAAVADSMKCREIRLLDVHKKVYWTDFFLILTAMSRTQMSAVLGKMEKVASDEFGIEVEESISKRTRDFYKLEDIYAKCEEIELDLKPNTESPKWQQSLKS